MEDEGVDDDVVVGDWHNFLFTPALDGTGGFGPKVGGGGGGALL